MVCNFKSWLSSTASILLLKLHLQLQFTWWHVFFVYLRSSISVSLSGDRFGHLFRNSFFVTFSVYKKKNVRLNYQTNPMCIFMLLENMQHIRFNGVADLHCYRSIRYHNTRINFPFSAYIKLFMLSSNETDWMRRGYYDMVKR